MNRTTKTEFIRRVQGQGIFFVCSRKDRALTPTEEACEECDCFSDRPPMSGQPRTDVLGSKLKR